MAKKAASSGRAKLPQAPAEIQVDVIKSDENWTQIHLSDGAILRMKPVVIEVTRAKGNYSADGTPIYNVRASIVIDAKVPDELKSKRK